MSQTPIRKFGTNKLEQRENLIFIAISAILAILMLILFFVFNGKVENMKNNLDYLIRPDFYADELNTLTGWATTSIVFFCIALVACLIAIYSCFMLHSASLSVYDDRIEGNAGIHWNGWCLITKSVTLPYGEILSVGVHKVKALQRRYVILSAKDGKRFTFAVDDVNDAIELIKKHLAEVA